MSRVYHEFEAYYQQDSKILILGSFPSVKSREVSFYYGHSQNRFWKVLANIFNDNVPITIVDKKQFLNRNYIALYDVIDSCEIKGSSDASIQNVQLTNLDKIINNSKIDLIVLNGKTASKYFVKPVYFEGKILHLPSTSAANARCSLDKLINEWKKITE